MWIIYLSNLKDCRYYIDLIYLCILNIKMLMFLMNYLHYDFLYSFSLMQFIN